MSDYSELVNELQESARTLREDLDIVNPNAPPLESLLEWRAAEAIERLEAELAALRKHVNELSNWLAEANESADKFCEQSLRDLGAAAKLEEQLAEARAEIERKDEALEAINKLHFPRSATMSDEEIVANLRSMAFEALAALAPVQEQMMDCYQFGTVTTEREAERRVVEAAMKWAATSSSSRKKQFTSDLVQACQNLFEAHMPKAAQQQALEASDDT